MILKLIFQVQLYYLMNENIIDTIHIIIYLFLFQYCTHLNLGHLMQYFHPS